MTLDPLLPMMVFVTARIRLIQIRRRTVRPRTFLFTVGYVRRGARGFKRVFLQFLDSILFLTILFISYFGLFNKLLLHLGFFTGGFLEVVFNYPDHRNGKGGNIDHAGRISVNDVWLVYLVV